MAHLAARFWDPQQGAISIGGVPLSDYAPETLVRLTASVFQDVFLFHDTILANLRVGAPDATREQVIAAAREAQIHDFIMTLPDGYDTVLGDRGARLSGGEKQRLSIARAILKDAPIVILDEATAFADPVNERRIRTALERLCRDKTVITIAHRLSTIQDADQIAVLDDGRLVDVGRHDILLTHCAVYQRLWSAYTSPWDGGNGSAAHPPFPARFRRETRRGPMIVLDVLRMADGPHAARVRRGMLFKIGETFCAAVPFAALYGALMLVFGEAPFGMGEILGLTGLVAAGLAGQFAFRSLAPAPPSSAATV